MDDHRPHRRTRAPTVGVITFSATIQSAPSRSRCRPIDAQWTCDHGVPPGEGRVDDQSALSGHVIAVHCRPIDHVCVLVHVRPCLHLGAVRNVNMMILAKYNFPLLFLLNAKSPTHARCSPLRNNDESLTMRNMQMIDYLCRNFGTCVDKLEFKIWPLKYPLTNKNHSLTSIISLKLDLPRLWTVTIGTCHTLSSAVIVLHLNVSAHWLRCSNFEGVYSRDLFQQPIRLLFSPHVLQAPGS